MAEASFGESAQFNNVAAICSKGLRDLYTTLHRAPHQNWWKSTACSCVSITLPASS